MKKAGFYIAAFLVFELILVFLYWGTTSIKKKEYFNIKYSMQKEINELRFDTYNTAAQNFLQSVKTNSALLNQLAGLNTGLKTVRNSIYVLRPIINEAQHNGLTIIKFYSSDFKFEYNPQLGRILKTFPKHIEKLKSMSATSFKKFAIEIDTNLIMYTAVFPIQLLNNKYLFCEMSFPTQSYEQKINISSKENTLHLISGSELNLFEEKCTQIFDELYYPPGKIKNTFIKSGSLTELKKEALNDKSLKKEIGKVNAVFVGTDNKNFILTFFPLRSINGSKIGYLVNFLQDDYIGKMLFQYQLLLGFSSLMLLIIFIYSFSEYVSKIKAKETNAILSSIKESPENVAILSLDKNYRILSFSKSYKRLFKEYYSGIVEEGKSKLDFHKDPLELKELRSYYDRAFKGEEFVIVERHENAQGEVKFLENRYNAISDSNDKVIGLTVFITDVTENKLAEKKLQKVNAELENEIAEKEQYEKILSSNNKFLNIVMDTIPSPFYFQNSSNIIQGCNTAFAEDILGQSKINVIGKSIEQLLSEGDKELAVSFNMNNSVLIERGGAKSYEASVKLSNGKLREMLFYKAAFTNETGQISGIVCVVIDITERKQSVAMLSSAKKAAEEANRAKSFFLASMSHEFRTPLNGILGYTQLLKKDDALTKFQRDAINSIHVSGEHLLALINDILDLSKIEAKKLELSNSKFNLKSLLKNVIDVFKMRSEKKGIDFFYEEKNSAPNAVIGDEVRVRQIIYNLLGNALKFTDSGSIILAVNFVNESSQFVKFKIKITDTGRGIPNDKLREIFEPFKQVDISGKKITGTGLGLAITLNLIEMMRGKIQVDSEVGKGTTFSVELMLEKGIEDVYEIEGSEVKIVGYQGIKKKILVVDDTEQVREFLTNLLAPLGFALAEAQNGLEALVKLKDFNPDIVLMDLVMPVMNGLETIKNIRSDPYDKNIPIIALSASVFADDRSQSLAAGSNIFMPKPINIEQLLNNIGKLIGIEWKYERVKIVQNLSEKFSDVAEINVTKEEEIPDVEILKKIKNRAVLGDISGINSILKELESSGKYEKFILKIGNFNNKFDTESIIKEINSFNDE